MGFGSGERRKGGNSGGGSALLEDIMTGWRAAQALTETGNPSSRSSPTSARNRTAKTRKPQKRAKGHRPPAKASPVRPLLGALSAPRRGRLEALGWFLAAGVILMWPRDYAILDWSFLKPRPKRLSARDEVAQAEALEPGRGRAARHPGEIPLRGWRDIVWRAWADFNKDNIPQVAGGVAFFGLLAVFPAMGAFVALYGLFFDINTVEQQLHLLSGVMPAAALDLISSQLVRLSQARSSGLGVAFVVSLMLSLWSANAGVKGLIVGLNIAFEEREKRNLIKLNLVSLAFTVGALVFIMVAMSAIIAVPIVTAFLGYKGSVLATLRWPLLLCVAVGALAVLYRYGPSRQRERWRWITWGSVMAAALWLGASLLFSIYVAHFGNYDKTYGSLGAAVGFLSWIWISAITVLFGAEVNSEIEHQTAVDTTTGEPLPMGERGAFMADTLGRARTARPSVTSKPADEAVPGRDPADERVRTRIRKHGVAAANPDAAS